MSVKTLSYFFGYKTMFFPFHNNPKYLDPPDKMDLDIWYCFGRGKTNFKAELHKTNLDVWGHSRSGKAPSYKQRNMVDGIAKKNLGNLK